MNNETPENPENKTTVIKPESFTTRPASENSRELFSQILSENIEANTLSIMLPGNEKPIVFRGNQKVLLGRRDENTGFIPQIDLTRYYGTLMGVSRKHAEIILQDGRCWIKDLNSSNGTWVNEVRLAPGQDYPLNNGDQVRLGQLLLLIFVTARSESDDNLETALLYLTDSTQFESRAVQGIVPSYLVTTLGVYLQTLSEIQQVIREAQGTPGHGLAVQDLRYHSATRTIQIDLLNATDLVTFLEKYLYQPEGLSSQTVIEAVADQLLKELVFRFLNNKRQDYLDRLKPLLETLFTSSLRIVSSAER
jgi:pSer/pThr/pTyr-binding forkhead associated (FHA) protein